ncbi:MAG: ATP-binding protein [Xanthomonadales bacterium]|nr:ATP-binding protein [Xanthomonadales bacterium]
MSTKSNQQRPISLRARLVVLAVLLLTISLGLVGFALDAAFQKSSEAGLQVRMESLVYLVLAATEVDDNGSLVFDDDPGDPRLGQPGSGIYASVTGERDRWASASSLGVSLPEPVYIQTGETDFLPASDETGLYYIFRYGVSWELPQDRLLPVTVTIFVDPQELTPELQAFRRGLWQSLGLAGLILVLAQMILLALGLRPLRRISEDISGIESGEIDRLEGNFPIELEPLQRNINHLLETEKANQGRYRNALDSLAHSLKTPLSVIRSSLPSDDSPKTVAMENAVTDMQHMIATRLQRAASSARSSNAPAMDVKTQLERLVVSLERVYSQKLISIDVIIDPGLAFYGEQRDFLELTGNLLDNACKYGNGQVQIAVQTIDAGDTRAGIRLQVDDNGPGIATGEREQLLLRGVRGDERVEGHGLGLAIVLEIVSAYDGDIAIAQSELGGARVSVTLKTR